MGLFGGLFEKKNCDICGEEIKLLGNRKLSDGNCCKNCESLLSPWFSERKQSTVQDIKDQIEYREQNKAALASFNPTITLATGTRTTVFIDENQGCFAISKDGKLDSNPDIIKFTDVTGCEFNIDEQKTEIQYKDSEGNRQSFTPKRYAYSYDFDMSIHVKHPYFDVMSFELNPSRVDNDAETLIEMPASGAARPGQTAGARPAAPGAARPGVAGAARPGQPGAARPGQPGAARPTAPGAARPGQPGAARPSQPMMNQGARPAMGGFAMGAGPAESNAADVQASAEYQKYLAMGEEIKSFIMQSRSDAREVQAQAAAPKMAMKCPYCGATVIPDANGCCEYCGGALMG